MTQNALKKESEGQTEENVSEALSSIRSVIKQNLEKGFDHFDVPEEGDHEDHEGQEKERELENVPRKTKEDLEALIKESEKKKETFTPSSESADVFFLTKILEEDGSITNLDKEKSQEPEESTEEGIKSSKIRQSDSSQTPDASASAETDSEKESSEEEDSLEDEASEVKDSAPSKDNVMEKEAAEPETEATEMPTEPIEKDDSSTSDMTSMAPGEEGINADTAEGMTAGSELETADPKESETEALILDASVAEKEVQNEASVSNSEETEVPMPDLELESKEPTDPLPSDSTEELASKETMAESAASFSELAKIARQMSSQSKRGGSGDGPSGPVTPDRAGGYTVEELMRELLRPMLKEWLDKHLPSLVKWLVTEQIEKMLQGEGLSIGRDSSDAPAPKAKKSEPATDDSADIDFDKADGTPAA